MKSQTLLTIAALLIGSSLARKSYLVKQEHFKMVPRVMADDPNCESCAYKTDEDEVCLEYEFQWKLGWEWSQDMIQNDRYDLRLDILSNQKMHLRPIISFPRFIFNQYDLTVDEFNIQYSIQMKLYYLYPTEGDKLCVNLFFNVEEVPVKFQQIIKLQDCYTLLVKCLYDWSQWTGKDAKFFDNCEQSSKEEIIMFEKDIEELTSYQLGTESEPLQKRGQKCSPQIDIIPLLPQNPVSTTLVMNALSWMGLGRLNGNLIDIKGKSDHAPSGNTIKSHQ